MKEKIPVTVAILTKNSSATLPKALQSVKDFAEIIVADGGSTDGTVAIAEGSGARVIAQNPAFLDSKGIRDFSGVRNQTYTAASHEWFLYVDADEMLSPEAVEEIRAVAMQNEPAVYWVPRVYTVGGERVRCSSSYPNRQMRLMHRSLVTGFVKPVHERPAVKAGAAVRTLAAPLLVPADLSDRAAHFAKMRRYIDLDLSRQEMTFPGFLTIAIQFVKSVLRFALFFPKWLFCSGVRLPLSSEFRAVVYQWMLVVNAKPSFMKFIPPVLVAMAFVAVAFFGTYKLSESPAIWYDEGFYTQMAMNFSSLGRQALQVAPGTYVSGAAITAGFPLTYPVSLAYKWFGVGVAQGRAVMALFLILFAIAAYVLARLLFGPWSAAGTALLTASFPMLYGNGKSVLGEVPGLFFLVLFLITLVYLERAGFRKVSLWALAGVCAGLAAVTKPIFILIVPAAGLVWLFRMKTIPLTLTRVAAGIGAFLVPVVYWFFTQFGPGDSLQTVLSFYINPYENSALLPLIVSNILKFFTEITPAYACVVLVVWGASLLIRRKKSAERTSVAETVGFVFSLLITAAFLRLPGWYRYLFPAIMPALIAFPFSAVTTYRFISEKMRFPESFSWLPAAGIALLVLAQFYQLGFHSYVADYYSGDRTHQMALLVGALPESESVFFYNVPELVVLLPHKNYYQFLEPHPEGLIGKEYLPVLEHGDVQTVLATAAAYAANPERFSRYSEERQVSRYVLLRLKGMRTAAQ